MEKYIGLKLKNGVGYRVQITKWDREIGDAMNIEGKGYTVIATGTRSHCIGVVNEEIEKINAVTREHNRKVREANKNRKPSEFERNILEIITNVLSR